MIKFSSKFMLNIFGLGIKIFFLLFFTTQILNAQTETLADSLLVEYMTIMIPQKSHIYVKMDSLLFLDSICNYSHRNIKKEFSNDQESSHGNKRLGRKLYWIESNCYYQNTDTLTVLIVKSKLYKGYNYQKKILENEYNFKIYKSKINNSFIRISYFNDSMQVVLFDNSLGGIIMSALPNKFIKIIGKKIIYKRYAKKYKSYKDYSKTYK